MPLIQVLDEQTANQIAAGEVVERPASVVKELVENALDAGASRIVVEVEGGGRELIRVTDDGCGMAPDDARLALARHATSKIRSAVDLHSIQTMGFRGEALPSVASVSRFELITRRKADLGGTRIEVEGGSVRREEEFGCPEGTRVTVRDLFYNVPARLKYLKTNATEMGQISDMLTRLALANPQTAIRFHSGQTQVFATPGTGELPDAIAALLGRELMRELLPVRFEDGAATVHGYVGRPGIARAGRNHQYFFVNRRAIRVIAVRYALEEAYAHLLPGGRYPVCILFLTVNPEEVDVNVHPTKAEVRFQRDREVRASVYRAARQSLGQHLLIPGTTISPDGEVTVPDRAGEKAAVQSPPGMQNAAVQSPPGSDNAAAQSPPGSNLPYVTSPGEGNFPRQVSFGFRGEKTTDRVREEEPVFALPAGTVHNLLEGRSRERQTEVPGGEWGEHSTAVEADLIRHLRPLGQVHRSYIACDGPEGLYLIDQHAAHERIFFERFLAAAQADSAPMQPLLFPITLDLTPATMALWREHADIFTESGFEAEPFGGATLLIKAVPLGTKEAHTARLITDFLDRLQEDRVRPGTKVQDRRLRVLAAMAACKASIRAHDALQPEDIAALLEDLALCQSPATCPHGRPTIFCVTVAELEKRFKR